MLGHVNSLDEPSVTPKERIRGDLGVVDGEGVPGGVVSLDWIETFVSYVINVKTFDGRPGHQWSGEEIRE